MKQENGESSSRPEFDRTKCHSGGTCGCNCCDRRSGKHCGQHGNRCHMSCGPS